MVLVTGHRKLDNIQLLSGIVLEEITEANFRKGVFNAFLVSDRVHEIICERPQYHGGIGTTREGLFVVEFETTLCGVSDYTERQSDEEIFSGVVENRIQLATTSNIDNVAYPAFLSARPVSPPTAIRAIVRLYIDKLEDFPEMRLFIARERYLLKNPKLQKSIGVGTILPVSYESGGDLAVAALEVGRPIGRGMFEAVIYYEAKSKRPAPGGTLGRKVTWTNPKNPEAIMQFSARIGVIDSVRG